MINILEVNNIDTVGAGFNGYNMITDIKNKNINISMAVIYKKSGNDKVTKILNNKLLNSFYYLNNIEEKLSVHNLLSITSPALKKSKVYKESDFLHFHMFHNTKLSITSLLEITREKKTIITLHDPWLLTGRCVHFYDCNKWENGCNDCKNLGNFFPFNEDNCSKMWEIKKEVLTHSNIEYIVTSEWMYNLAMKSSFIADKSCIHLIPLGVDLNIFKPQPIKNRYNIPQDNIVIFMRAQNEFKGTKYAIDALKELETNAKITIITCDNKHLLDSLKDKYNIIDLGLLSQEQLVNAYNLCDIFLMPSTAESFGMMGVEAMACAKPVIAFNNTAIPSVLNSPDCGYVVQNRNSHELMLAIKELVNNEKERKRRGELGRKICKEKYSYEEYLKKIEGLYLNLYSKNYYTNLEEYNKYSDDMDYMKFYQSIIDFLNKKTIQEPNLDVEHINYINRFNDDYYEEQLSTNERSFLPKISVIIPVYNGENYLNQAIESVLSQTYANYEVLVIDDGSTDNTRKVANKYKNKIKYYYKENGGVASALNYGITKMTGEYFAWLSHDDKYEPNKLEVQVTTLAKLNNKNTILFSNFNLVDSNNKLITEVNYLKDLAVNELCRGYYPVVKGCINGCTILINKCCFDKVGYFDEKLKTSQDYDMWLKLFKEFPSFCISECLVSYRIHPMQDTNRNPVTLIESNNFWKNLIQNISDEDIKKWNVKPFDVYMSLAIQMKNSNYNKAYDLAYEKAKEIYLNNNTPEISIIMPCYNAEKYIGDAIKSVSEQLFTNFELLIINDSSTDKTEKIINKYILRDFRIKYFNNRYEKGVSGALNTGLDEARGKYFARLDADDTMLPDKLLKQYKLLETKKYSYVGTNINFMDNKSTLYSFNIYDKYNVPIEYMAAFKNPIPNATIMYSLDQIRKYNMHFSNYKTSEDYQFLLNYILATKGKGYFIEDGLYNYRVLNNSLFHSNIDLSIELAQKFAKEYFIEVMGCDNKYYYDACEFYYNSSSKKRSINSKHVINVYREFYEKATDYFSFDDNEKNEIIFYIANKMSELNKTDLDTKLPEKRKKAYIPKSKIANKFLYYYRTHGFLRTAKWILIYPIRQLKKNKK